MFQRRQRRVALTQIVKALGLVDRWKRAPDDGIEQLARFGNASRHRVHHAKRPGVDRSGVRLFNERSYQAQRFVIPPLQTEQHTEKELGSKERWVRPKHASKLDFGLR